MSLMLRAAGRTSAAAVVPLEPTAISGLQAYYRAQDIAGADNVAVTSWPDTSGNLRHATQAIALNQPTLQTNELNGKAVVRFDGNDDSLSTPSFTVNQPDTIMVVSKSTGSGLRKMVDSVTTRQLIHQSGANLAEAFAGTVLSTPGTINDSVPRIYIAEFNGASTVLNKNSTSTTGNAGSNALSGAMRIGVGANGTSDFWSGDIAEVAVWNRLLTAAEKASLLSHLSTYYGIAL